MRGRQHGVEVDGRGEGAEDADGLVGRRVAEDGNAAQQLAFNQSIANLAHAQGFTVALKNDPGQTDALQPYFDFAVNEQCFQYSTCNNPAPGLQVWPSTYGKAVFNVEYAGKTSTFCPLANGSSYNFNSIQKNANLYDTPWTPCRG